MDNNDTTATYWVTAIIVVLAIVAAVWWYTAQSVSPGVPNTGTDTTNDTASTSRDYMSTQ